MTKDDIRHPAFKSFMAYADSDVLLTSPLEDAWETYKEGWMAACLAVAENADAQQKAEEPAIEFPELKPDRDDKDRIPQFTQTQTGIIPKTCARCPNPKSPSPEFHTTGIAHTPPPKEQNRCQLPPEGWKCTLPKGHSGPCPTKIDNDRFINGQP